MKQWVPLILLAVSGPITGWTADRVAPPQVGVSLSPAICLVTRVPVGQAIDLTTMGYPYLLVNRGSAIADLTLTGVEPITGGMLLWEYGYEPIPDASWIRCSPETLVMNMSGQISIAVTISVPNEARWAGRKFVAGVQLKTDHAEGIGAGLAMCARLLFETTDRLQPDAGGGWLATVPGTLRIAGVTPGSSAVSRLSLRNGTQAPLHLVARRLADAEPRTDKRLDYLTVQATPQAWMPVPPPIELAAGGEVSITLPYTIPPTTRPGSYEDVLLFATPDAWATVDAAAAQPNQRITQPRVAAVRVCFDVTRLVP